MFSNVFISSRNNFRTTSVSNSLIRLGSEFVIRIYLVKTASAHVDITWPQSRLKCALVDGSHWPAVSQQSMTKKSLQWPMRRQWQHVIQLDLHAKKHFWNYCTTTVLRPFYRDHPGEPVPEENFWTLWCKGRLTEADIQTIRLGATPSGLISAHLHHPPPIFYRPDALPAAQPTVSKHWRQLAHSD